MSDPNAHGRFGTAPTANLETPKIALAIGAHPDDVDFGCGGTLAKWAAAGCAVHYLVCTDGSKGSWDPAQDRAELVRLRQDEQRDASRHIGGEGRVTFLGLVDGELDSGMETRSRVAYEIRRVRPDVVLGHDPWKRYRLHPDHRHAGFLTTDGIVAARDPHFFPDHDVDPHRPTSLLLWEADEPDHIEDIGGHQETKLEALLAHRSQFESTMKIGAGGDTGAVAAFAERLRNRQAQAGAPLGLTAGEAFKLLTDL
ncbi:MAG TPA: PIG-L deacetylase family protein [Acidimicrobiales bacterium]|jgi:LmbE family N-acetylglucosaminyl deacetylase|nr:PIG-L deacetylase family protein [Acidimicrobiales bacterium]